MTVEERRDKAAGPQQRHRQGGFSGRWRVGAAWALLKSNTQGELSPLERGLHALQFTEKAEVSTNSGEGHMA